MCRNRDISLEAEPKCKLHRARAADLENGAHLAQNVARTESVSKSLGSRAKARTGRVESQLPGILRIAGISEVGMIEDVERVRAELEASDPPTPGTHDGARSRSATRRDHVKRCGQGRRFARLVESKTQRG